MPISLDCLIQATLAWIVPSPVNGGPLVRHLIQKVAASRFGLSINEGPTFDLCWKIYEGAHSIQKAFDAEIRSERSAAFSRIANIVAGRATYQQRGYRHVARLEDDRPYVIFSDHHVAHAGHRQDFFAASGNRELYQDVLSEYASSEYVLLENGDVEELLIPEPTIAEASVRAELAGAGDIDHPLGRTWQAYDDYRLTLRQQQLVRILASNRSLYQQINDQFLAPGRYLRIAGNHDQDLQEPALLERLRTVYPGLPTPHDFVIIEPSKGDRSPFVIGHGHHFDLSCTPKYAPRLGESYSESLAWAFQGADRIWSWQGDDDVVDWTNGAPFLNNLVTAEPGSLTASDVGLDLALVVLGLGIGAPGLSLDAATELVSRQVQNPEFWESVFARKIAWEYFESPSRADNVFNEVLCGREWFKFRHLDEIVIADRWEESFSGPAPTLILGHSHEPRHDPFNQVAKRVCPSYVNSGAAGRFENLLWAVEIVAGEPQVVAWHRPGGPHSGAAPVRHAYTPSHDGVNGYLVPSTTGLPIPKPPEHWLEPVLHMMMG